MTIDANQWNALAGPELRSTEAQLLPKFIKPLSSNDQAQFDAIFQQQSEEFATYGLKLDGAKVRDAFKLYQKGTEDISKDEVLTVLYLSDDDTLLRSASFILAHYLKTSEDLLDVLPLLLRKQVGVQAAVEAYVEDFEGEIDWRVHSKFLPQLLNNPNPFTSLLVLKLMEKTGVTRETLEQCLHEPIASFQEILQSEAMAEEKIYLQKFLDRHSLKLADRSSTH